MKRTFDRSRIKAAVFDIDGTLYSYGFFPEGTAETLKALAASGVQIFIDTGRSPGGLPPQIKAIEEFRYVIFCDGAIVEDRATGEEISFMAMSVDKARYVCEFMWQFSKDLHLDVKGYGMITESDFQRFLLNYPEGSQRKEAGENLKKEYTIVPDEKAMLEAINEPVIKIGCRLRSREEVLDALGKVRASLDCDVVETDANLIELTERGVNKANGLKILCSHLNIRPEEVVAFGDSGNDIPMLRCAGYSVAMGNAYDNVKEEADMVTGSVRDGGAIMAVRELFGSSFLPSRPG